MARKSKKRGRDSKISSLRKKLQLEQDMINKQIAKKSPKKSQTDILKEKLQIDQEEIDKGTTKQEKVEEIETAIEDESDVQKEVDEIVESSKEAPSQTSLPQAKKIGKKIKEYQKILEKVRKEVKKIIIGQEEAVKGLLRAIIADGHVLLEGVPGIAKTTLIRSLAKTTGCSFSRIQFTPDLLPTDIIGISTYQEGRGFYTLKGPIFNNFILADEINRAPPKVQSALLESMAEKQATIAKESFPVPLPFFTMATQNPLENVGTYSLPEAQIDRFLFKLYMGYPNIDEEKDILRTNIGEQSFDTYQIKAILDPDSILQIQADTKKIYVDKKVEKYIVKIIDATRNPKKYDVKIGKYIEYGASPRGSIGLFSAARAEAMINGQTYVTPHNVKMIAFDVLRHRLLISYEGQAENITSEMIIKEILKKVPVH